MEETAAKEALLDTLAEAEEADMVVTEGMGETEAKPVMEDLEELVEARTLEQTLAKANMEAKVDAPEVEDPAVEEAVGVVEVTMQTVATEEMEVMAEAEAVEVAEGPFPTMLFGGLGVTTLEDLEDLEAPVVTGITEDPEGKVEIAKADLTEGFPEMFRHRLVKAVKTEAQDMEMPAEELEA